MVPPQSRLDVGKLKDERVAEEFVNRPSGVWGVQVLGEEEFYLTRDTGYH